MSHPRTKHERICIRRQKYRKRMKERGLDPNPNGELHKAYVHQAQPCSCIMCAGEKYKRNTGAPDETE